MTCEQCDADIHHRQVTLDLGGVAGKHTFCSDGCKHTWTEKQLRRWSYFLNRIFIRARGFARDLARLALHTNEQP
jgi:nitrate reductase beta subunit